MSKSRKSKKSAGKKSGPERVLIECSPYRSTGGRYIEGLTPYPAEHESHNENHAIWVLPLCHDVLKISSQASREPYFDADGKLHHHTPDYTVETPDGLLVLELKSLSWLAKPKELSKYLQIALSYLARKIPFAFLVDVQINQTPMFQSVNLLRRYVQCELKPEINEKIMLQLRSGPMNIDELLRCASVELVDVYVLIAQKFICFDWNKPLDRDSLVSLPNQPYEGLKLANILRSTRYGGLLEELALGRRPTDQSILADATNWRQHRQPPSPFQFVGGFAAGTPVRDLGEEESRTGTAWSRRGFAPGIQPFKTDLV